MAIIDTNITYCTNDNKIISVLIFTILNTLFYFYENMRRQNW